MDGKAVLVHRALEHVAQARFFGDFVESGHGILLSSLRRCEQRVELEVKTVAVCERLTQDHHTFVGHQQQHLAIEDEVLHGVLGVQIRVLELSVTPTAVACQRPNTKRSLDPVGNVGGVFSTPSYTLVLKDTYCTGVVVAELADMSKCVEHGETFFF
jgi:hypothetical protein